MGNLALHTIVRQVIEKHGPEILSDIRLASILSDIGAFDRLPNGYEIVKDLQETGFGALLLNCKNSQDAKWQSEIDGFTDDFLSVHAHYDSAEVLYICDAFAFGLDMLTEDTIRKNGYLSLSSYSYPPMDYGDELQKLQKEYISFLRSSIVVPEGTLFKKPSGYYPIEAQNKLYLLENKILMLGEELEQDLQLWCASEKQKVLEENAHPVAPQRIGLVSSIVAPAAAIFILVTNLVSFLGAKNAVSTFKKEIAYADSLYQAKDYMLAVNAYNLAGNAYNESYKQSKYKGIAKSGFEKGVTSLVSDYLNKAQPLYNKADYYEALKVLNSIPDGVDCSFDKKLAKRLATMRSDLESKCEILLISELDGFIEDISKSKGKPSREVLDRIDYLLTVDPSNYWLSFIKKKSAEK